MRTRLLGALALCCAVGTAPAQTWPVQPLSYPGPYPSYQTPPGVYPTTSGWPQQAPMPPVQGFHYSEGLHVVSPYQGPPVGPNCPRPIPSPEFVADPPPLPKPWFWGSADIGASWTRAQRSSVPLVTTGTQLTPRLGAIDQPDTRVLFNSSIHQDAQTTIRGELGLFIDEGRQLSVEAVGLWLLPQHERFRAASDATGTPPILRPAFDVVSGSEVAFIDALPGIASGSVDIDARTELFGFEANTRYHHYMIENQLAADALVGFRYLRLSENLTIRDQFQPLVGNTLTFLGTPLNAGDQVSDTDQFETKNKFYGIQFGGRLRVEGPCWLVHGYGKVAVGATDQDVNITGQSSLVTPTSNQIAGGGILALPSNIGAYSRTVFSVVPEGGINVGLKYKNCQLIAGYSFLFWSQVARPGAQIDRTVNSTTIPTAVNFGALNTSPARPIHTFDNEGFFLHTLSLRLALAY